MQKTTSIDSLSPRSISTNSMNLPKNGALLVPLTNDYLFRALLQQNNLVL